MADGSGESAPPSQTEGRAAGAPPAGVAPIHKRSESFYFSSMVDLIAKGRDPLAGRQRFAASAAQASIDEGDTAADPRDSDGDDEDSWGSDAEPAPDSVVALAPDSEAPFCEPCEAVPAHAAKAAHILDALRGDAVASIVAHCRSALDSPLPQGILDVSIVESPSGAEHAHAIACGFLDCADVIDLDASRASSVLDAWESVRTARRAAIVVSGIESALDRLPTIRLLRRCADLCVPVVVVIVVRVFCGIDSLFLFGDTSHMLATTRRLVSAVQILDRLADGLTEQVRPWLLIRACKRAFERGMASSEFINAISDAHTAGVRVEPTPDESGVFWTLFDCWNDVSFAEGTLSERLVAFDPSLHGGPDAFLAEMWHQSFQTGNKNLREALPFLVDDEMTHEQCRATGRALLGAMARLEESSAPRVSSRSRASTKNPQRELNEVQRLFNVMFFPLVYLASAEDTQETREMQRQAGERAADVLRAEIQGVRPEQVPDDEGRMFAASVRRAYGELMDSGRPPKATAGPAAAALSVIGLTSGSTSDVIRLEADQ
eukprot:m51a1_g6708 hypothetical protein (547) ;mRNA; f:117395-119091